MKKMKMIEIILDGEKLFQCLKILKKYVLLDEHIVYEIKSSENKKIKVEYRGQVYETTVLKNAIKVEAIIPEESIEQIIEDLMEINKNGIKAINIYDVIDTIPKIKTQKTKTERKIEEIENLTREELLKQLGIREPDENFIETLIKDAFEFENELTDKEIKDLSTAIENRIEESVLSILKDQDLIEDYAIKVKIEKSGGKEYLCTCDILLIQKKTLGFIKKPIKLEPIKKRIINILEKENVSNLRYSVKIRQY